MLVLQFFTTAMAEEPGWRHFALPRLQERFGAIRGTVLLGTLWGCWHLPLFLSDWGGWPHVSPLAPVEFVAACIPLSLVMTWVFNRTGQSLPIVMILHAGINTTYSSVWTQIFPTLDLNRDPLHVQLIATTAIALVLIIVTSGRLGLSVVTDPSGGGGERAPARAAVPGRGEREEPGTGIGGRLPRFWERLHLPSRHLVEEWFTGRVPDQLFLDQPVGPREERRARTPDVGRDQDVRHPPQRVVRRQRLRVGDVERGAQGRPLLSRRAGRRCRRAGPGRRGPRAPRPAGGSTPPRRSRPRSRASAGR